MEDMIERMKIRKKSRFNIESTYDHISALRRKLALSPSFHRTTVKPPCPPTNLTVPSQTVMNSGPSFTSTMQGGGGSTLKVDLKILVPPEEMRESEMSRRFALDSSNNADELGNGITNYLKV